MDPVELARKVLSQPPSELGAGIEAVRALVRSSPRAQRRPYTIIEALHDRRLLGALPDFADLTTWTPWLTFLSALYGLPLS